MQPNSALAFVFQILLLNAFGNNIASGQLIFGGEMEQDASNPVYKVLATKSLQQYMKENGLSLPNEVTKVTRATTQVVDGIITRLNFNALISYTLYTCRSKIFEQPWIKVEQINVNCDKINVASRFYEHIIGGETAQNVNDPLYTQLAEESLNKYVADSGIFQSHRVVKVNRVTKQVVAGFITRIEFDALLDSNPVTCQSKIFEQDWMHIRDINVKCVYQDRRANGPPIGGLEEEDVNDPIYIQLAFKSLEKYKKEKGITPCIKFLHVLKVTKQVVAGTMIRIDFEAMLVNSNDIICHSEIWQRPWLNKEEINVNCFNKY